jgi:protein-disulfide isomerase
MYKRFSPVAAFLAFTLTPFILSNHASAQAAAGNVLQTAAVGATAVQNRADINQSIHDYILAHPEVMLQSIRDFDTRRKATEQAQKDAKVRQNLSQLQNGSPTLGVNEAQVPVTIVEFFDYRCGYCKKSQPTVDELAKRPGIRIVYKDLPILGPDSMTAAKAALAADKQGGYQKLHDAMIASSAPLTTESITKLATELGLNAEKLHKDMDSPEVQAAIANNIALAEKLSVQATPTFVVGEQLVSGALTPEAFNDLIKKANPLVTRTMNNMPTPSAALDNVVIAHSGK